MGIEEPKLTATRSQIEEFGKSLLWQDICRELDFWLDGFKGEEESVVDRIAAENLSTPAAFTLVGSIDGRRKAVAHFKAILDVFTSILDERKEDDKPNNDGDENGR